MLLKRARLFETAAAGSRQHAVAAPSSDSMQRHGRTAEANLDREREHHADLPVGSVAVVVLAAVFAVRVTRRWHIPRI